jgi:hypothetical protein
MCDFSAESGWSGVRFTVHPAPLCEALAKATAAGACLRAGGGDLGVSLRCVELI